ncbi:MAG: hypothetical protein ACP5UB_08455 [Candidatus Sumerlaeaceae bacterium]
MRTSLAHATLWLAVLVAYAPVLTGAQHIWDDEAFLGNPLLLSLSGLFRVWFDPRSNTLEEHYWPVTYTVAYLLRTVWGSSPGAFHIVNVLIHAGNASLVYSIGRRVLAHHAFWGALLFALHPLQVESVAWIVELKNVLSFFLAASSFLVFLSLEKKQTGKRLGMALGWSLFVAAMLSKSAVITWPLCAGLILWCLPPGLTKTRIQFLAGLIVAALAVGAFDMWYASASKSAVPRFSIAERVAISGTGLLHYLRTWLWPSSLCATYAKWPLTPLALTVAVCVGIVMAGAVVALARRAFHSRAARMALAWLVGTLALLAPTLGLIPFSYQRQSFVADRFAYHASAIFLPGVVAIMAAAWARMRLPARIGKIALVVISCALAISTLHRAALYRDVEYLAIDTAEKNPHAWTARYYLGDALARRGDFEKAMREFSSVFWGTLETFGRDEENLLQQQLTKADAQDLRTHYNRGLLAARRGRTAEAKACFEKASILPLLRGQAVLAIAAIELKNGETTNALRRIRELYGGATR